MTIGSPFCFISASRGRVTGGRPVGESGWELMMPRASEASGEPSRTSGWESTSTIALRSSTWTTTGAYASSSRSS